MDTLKDYIKNAEKIATQEFIKNVPTVGDFLKFYSPIFKKGKKVGGILCDSDVRIGIFTRKDKKYTKLAVFHHDFSTSPMLLSLFKDRIDVGVEKYDEHVKELNAFLDRKIIDIEDAVDGRVKYDCQCNMPDSLRFEFDLIVEE
jgi:hypothetical protein